MGRLAAALRVPVNGKGHFPFFGDNTQKLDLQSVYSQSYNRARLNFVQEVKVAGVDGAKFYRHKTESHGTVEGVQGQRHFPCAGGAHLSEHHCTPFCGTDTLNESNEPQ